MQRCRLNVLEDIPASHLHAHAAHIHVMAGRSLHINNSAPLTHGMLGDDGAQLPDGCQVKPNSSICKIVHQSNGSQILTTINVT